MYTRKMLGSPLQGIHRPPNSVAHLGVSRLGLAFQVHVVMYRYFHSNAVIAAGQSCRVHRERVHSHQDEGLHALGTPDSQQIGDHGCCLSIKRQSKGVIDCRSHVNLPRIGLSSFDQVRKLGADAKHHESRADPWSVGDCEWRSNVGIYVGYPIPYMLFVYIEVVCLSYVEKDVQQCSGDLGRWE